MYLCPKVPQPLSLVLFFCFWVSGSGLEVPGPHTLGHSLTSDPLSVERQELRRCPPGGERYSAAVRWTSTAAGCRSSRLPESVDGTIKRRSQLQLSPSKHYGSLRTVWSSLENDLFLCDSNNNYDVFGSHLLKNCRLKPLFEEKIRHPFLIFNVYLSLCNNCYHCSWCKLSHCILISFWCKS